MKRILSFLIAAIILCSNIVPVVSFAQFDANPFSALDECREASIKQGLGRHLNTSAPSTAKTPSSGLRYAVKFKTTPSLLTVYDCVSQYDYTLLSDSTERMFALRINNLSDFRNKYGSIVEFIEEDEKLSISAVVNDPMSDTQWELESLNVYSAWDIATGSNDVTVAILDSGVYRGHEDFVGVDILAGYDAVVDTEGVNADYNGHGTKIASIIAAANNNRTGMASLGAGLSILPIRVSDSTGFVYSTDFIQALYFAADSGADIINMSFGGYVYSAAEEAAAEYAASRGCILVAAAGNEGTDIKYAGMKAYPASYANVISVGSVNSKGEHCSFSQYNDAVDLVAPGEELTVANAYGEYEIENGTSFSTAYVSAVIGLALSAIDDGIGFTSEQFVTLVASLNGNSKSDIYGYGFINAAEILSAINRPLYSGVVDNGVYHKNININFNRGLASLDGEVFESGDMVLVSGKHTLTIEDGDALISIDFITDNIPLTYEYTEDDNKATINFNRGTATLDGVPYLSGAPISSNGKHLFVLTGPYGNNTQYSFECNFSAPVIFGVENGGFYTEPVRITTTDADSLLLNGVPFNSGDVVAANGAYTITANKNNSTSTVRFTIANPDVALYDASVTSAKLIVDDAYQTVCLYNDIISGLRILDTDNLNKTKSFLRTEYSILNHSFYGEYIVLLHSQGFSLISRIELANGTASPTYYNFSRSSLAGVIADGSVVYISEHSPKNYSLRKVNIENKNDDLITELNEHYKYICYCDGTVAIATENGVVCGYNLRGERIFKNSTGFTATGIILFDDCFTTGKYIYNKASKAPLFTIQDEETPICFHNGFLITDRSVYDVTSGIRVGQFEHPINHIFLTENAVYKYLSNAKIEVIKSNEAYELNTVNKKLNAADCTTIYATEPEQTSVFSETISLQSNHQITDVAIDFESGILYAISTADKSLLCFDTENFSFIKSFNLRYAPSSICHNGKNIYISFEDIAVICSLSGINDECVYTNSPRAYTAIKACGDTIFGLNTAGDLYSFMSSSPQNSVAVIKEQKIIDFDIGKNCIFALLKPSTVALVYKISMDNFSIESSATLNTEICNIVATENFVFIGNKAFDADKLKLQRSFEDAVCFADKQYVVTSTALYRTSNFEQLGKHPYDTTLPIFDDKHNYFSFYGNTVLKVKACSENLYDVPKIEGITDDATLQGPVTPTYSYGVGYVDGSQIAPGDLVENGGRHTFTLCLPFGIQKSYSFYIEAVINRIDLNYAKTTIGVNESISATVSAYPLPTVNVDTVYEASNGNAVVYEDGTVIGVTPGECVITAMTVDGLHSASFTLNITESSIIFDSSYFKEKDNNIVGNISPGTSIEAMLSAVSTTNGLVIATTKDNIHLDSGVITTDMKAVLYNVNGELIDERFLSVIGDLDCDGYITANDYCVLETLSAQPDSMSLAIRDAADVDGNGSIDAFDALTLKEHLLGQNFFTDPNTTIQRTARAAMHLIMPNQISKNTTFSSGITLTNAQNVSGVAGKICFDSAAYTVIDVSVIGAANIGFYTIEADGIHFFVKCNPLLETQVVAIISFNAVKAIDEVQNPYVSVEDIVLYDGSAAICAPIKNTPKISETPINDIKVFNLPDFVFQDEILNYSLDLPQASSYVYISAYPSESFNITGNTQFVGDTAEFSVISNSAEGKTKYNFICSTLQADIPVTDNTNVGKNDNSFLRDVEVLNGCLSPRFDKDIIDYYIVCDVPDSVKITASPEHINAVVSIENEAGLITVKCTAESGSSTTYRFHLTAGAPYEIPKTQDFNIKKWLWIAIGAVAVALLAALTSHQVKVITKKDR